MKKKLIIVIASAILGLALLGGLAYATTYHSIWEAPAQVEVIEGVSVWQEAECRTPVTTIDFGKVPRGEKSSPIPIFVRNDTNTLLDAWVEFTGMPNISGTVTFGVSGNPPIIPNEVREYAIQLRTAEDATLGIHNFKVRVCQED